jgi:hypothetical protein
MPVIKLGDKKTDIKSTWINQSTGELVTVEGIECPEGCRNPDREEKCSIYVQPICSEGRTLSLRSWVLKLGTATLRGS